MQPSDLNPDAEEKLEQVNADEDRPAASDEPNNTVDDDRPDLPADYPSKDTGIDATEAYDTNFDTASGAEPPLQNVPTAVQPLEPDDDTQDEEDE